MDLEEGSSKKQCYKFGEKLLDSVNIIHNKSNNYFVCWNKYQIILYEDGNFESATKLINPQYQIQCLLLSKNCLVNLDVSNNVHLIPLNLKKVSQRCFKGPFQPRATGVQAIAEISNDYIITLNREEATFYFSVHKLNQELYLEKRAILTLKEQVSSDVQLGIIMNCYTVKKENLIKLHKVFNFEDNSRGNYSLIVISFDRKTLYGCIFDINTDCDEISFVKLYSCPSEISNIQIYELQMYVGLAIGTILKLSIIEPLAMPKIIHLNTAITKFSIYNNSILYTDSQSIWKAENINEELKLMQIFVRNVKDFINLNDLVICTTYSKLIYKFSIEDKDAFLNVNSKEYCPVENFLDDSDCLQKIMEYVEENEELAKKLEEEETHLTALALSNHPNLIDDVIKSTAIVYKTYLDVLKENTEVILTENISNYFSTDILILINITMSTVQHKLNKHVQNIFDNSRILIAISYEGKSLKSSSTKLCKENQNFKCLIPLEDIDHNNIDLNISIVTDIPGVFDKKTNVVTVLYKKDVKLNVMQIKR